MPIDSAPVNSLSAPAAPSTTRLMGYGFLAGLLMLLDQRGDYIPRLRVLAEQVVSPVYQVAEVPVEAVRSISTYGQSFEELLERNQAQRERLLAQSGAMQRLAALEEENRRLRSLLEATEGRDLEFRFAELIQVSLDPNSHQVLIDRGEEDGVFVGQAVIDGQGVMGQVENTTGRQARVRLISDPEHAIPVQILRTGQRTVALGTGEPGRLSMPNLPMQSDVRVGDRIVTSGLGERFPAGFPVAEVTLVDRPTGAAFMNVDALPLATLDRGREVLLVLETFPVPGAGEPDATGADGSAAAEAAAVKPVDDEPAEPAAAEPKPDGPPAGELAAQAPESEA